MKNSIVPPVLLIFLSLLTAVIATGRVNSNTKQLAVIFPPGRSLVQNAASVAQVGGRLIRAGAGNSILIVDNSRDNIPAELYAHGAWLVFNAAVAGGCFFKSELPSVTAQTRNLSG